MKKALSLTDIAGFSLIEILLASTLLGLMVMTSVGAFLYAQENTLLAGRRYQAVLLAEEGLEAARNLRDGDFDSLSTGTHGLSHESGQWTFSGSSDTQGLFTREVEVVNLDSNRKQVTSTVNWQQNLQRSGSVSLTTELSYWMKEQAFSIFGDWANGLIQSTLDMAGSNDGWKVQTQGNYAYATRKGGDPSLAVVNIADPANPTLSDSLAFSAWSRDLVVSGGYVYMASRQSNEELKVIDVSDPNNITQVGGYDVPGSAGGEGIFLVGSTLYMNRVSTSADELVIFDVSIPSRPVLLGSVNLGATAYDLTVLGNYAYSVSDSDTAEVIVVDISDPTTPQLVTQYDLEGVGNAWSVNGFGNTLLVGRETGEVYLMDVSDPVHFSILSTYQAGDDVQEIALANQNQYLFLATDSDQTGLQVVDISNPSNPVALGGVNSTWDLNAIAYNNELDRAVGMSEDNTGEFIVFSPL